MHRVSESKTATGAGMMARLAGYRSPYPGTQPKHLHPPYVSSIKRAPTKPPVRIPYTLSETTGPSFGPEIVAPDAGDLAFHFDRKRELRRSEHTGMECCATRSG